MDRFRRNAHIMLFILSTLLLSLMVASDNQRERCGALSSAGMRPFKVVLSCSFTHVPVFFNWLVFYDRWCPSARSALHVMCLDRETERALGKVGLRCHHRYGFGSTRKFNNLWVARTGMVSSLLSEGYDVLMSDNDALWLQNPWPLVHKASMNSSVDIVSSRGKHPEEMSAKMGACLCFGFMYVKSTAITKAFWTFFADGMHRANYADDQRFLNYVLMRFNIRYRRRPKYVGFDDTDYGIIELPERMSTDVNLNHGPQGIGIGGASPSGIITGFWKRSNPQERMMRIALLGHESFRRVCKGQNVNKMLSHSVILHCHTEKVGNSKMALLQKLGLWMLREDVVVLLKDGNGTAAAAAAAAAAGGGDGGAYRNNDNYNSNKSQGSSGGKSEEGGQGGGGVDRFLNRERMRSFFGNIDSDSDSDSDSSDSSSSSSSSSTHAEPAVAIQIEAEKLQLFHGEGEGGGGGGTNRDKGKGKGKSKGKGKGKMKRRRTRRSPR